MKDPFMILSIDKTATKQQILARAAAAMGERHYAIKLIAEAQKELFDPVLRGAAEFSHFIDTRGCIGAFEYETPGNGDIPVLEMLDYSGQLPDEKAAPES
jgi:hypothetical protein